MNNILCLIDLCLPCSNCCISRFRWDD